MFVYEICDNKFPGAYRKWSRWARRPYSKALGRRVTVIEETPGEIIRARLDGKCVKFVKIETTKASTYLAHHECGDNERQSP